MPTIRIKDGGRSTQKALSLIERHGTRVLAIACAINRSFPLAKTYRSKSGYEIPIFSVVEVPTPQYRQDDPLVAEAIRQGNISWKPKTEWSRFDEAMIKYT